MSGKHKTVPVFVPHLGCPQDCLFCNQRAITGQRDMMTPEKAAAIIDACVRQKNDGDFVEIGFFGGSFTGISEEMQDAFLETAHKAVLEGKADGIRLSTRPDYIDETVIARLKRFGVTTVELGAQSMCDAVLFASHRGHTAAQTVAAARMIQSAGIRLGLQMMLGLPGDSFAEAVKTAQKFIELKPVCVRIYPTLVLKDTALAELFLNDRYAPLNLDEAVEQCAVIYRMFADANIDVIRMGLLETEPESLCAGPYHPAFGELVLSRDCFLRLKTEMLSLGGKKISVTTHPRFVSVLVGQKRENIKKLMDELDINEITVEQSENIPFGEFFCSVK